MRNSGSDCLARLVMDNPGYHVGLSSPKRPTPYIERVMDGKIEIWKVNDEAQKFKYNHGTKQHQILQILYNLFLANPGEWIPHETFIQQTGWKKESYFGGKGLDNGLMNKRLYEIRSALGIDVKFDKKNGCKIVPPQNPQDSPI